MSRNVLLLALAAIPAAAPARPAGPDEAIAAQRAMVRGAVVPACDRSEPDAIVVCGRDDSARHRLPLPVAAEPGARDRAGGEQLFAMDAGQDPCTTVGPNQRCSGGLPILPMVFKAIEGLRNLSERGDD